MSCCVVGVRRIVRRAVMDWDNISVLQKEYLVDHSDEPKKLVEK